MSMLTWLEGLGRRRTLPSSPARREIREYAQLLAKLRNDLPDDAAQIRNAELQAAWFTAQLEEQAREFRVELRVCYVVIVCLIAILAVLTA